jgi:hypothetical protein
MFVPSLSWQNDRFYIQMAQKCGFSQGRTPTTRLSWLALRPVHKQNHFPQFQMQDQNERSFAKTASDRTETKS